LSAGRIDVPLAVAYSSPFVPAEWIAAYGLRPLRLTPGPSAMAAMAGVCPFAHDFLQAILGRGQASMDAPVGAAVFTATCDQMRRAGELASSHLPTFLMHVPATWQTEAVVRLYIDELRRLGEFLISVGGIRPSDAALVETISAFDQRRQRLATTQAAGGPAMRLAIAGGPLRRQDQWIVEHLRQAGASVVLDATEYGERSLPAMIDRERLVADPLKELAQAYFLTIPDAFRRPDTLLHDYLRQKLAATCAQALLLLRFVWCDQWHAQVASLRESLPVPVVDIDLGQNGGDRGRAASRLDALLDTLR
jgi:benzoyl-CoA reductase/2-hydroxyglutaryl-CoA dehydratase subunit BcrC/BadD/HgdB